MGTKSQGGYEPRVELQTVILAGSLIARSSESAVLRMQDMTFEIPAADLVDVREGSEGQAEVRVRRSAQILVQTLVSPEETGRILGGRGWREFRSSSECDCSRCACDCTECSRCACDCTDCSRCSECSRCSSPQLAGSLGGFGRFRRMVS